MSGYIVNQTYDNFGTEFSWSLGWSHQISWGNESSEHGLLSYSEFITNPYANVTFTFPLPGIAFHYFGFQRTDGGRYGICTDCDPDREGEFDLIDSVNLTATRWDPPRILYSKRWDAAATHKVRLWNLPDTRFPEGRGQLTIDRIVVEVVLPESTTSTSTSTSITSSSSSSPSLSTSSLTLTSSSTTTSSEWPVPTATLQQSNDGGGTRVNLEAMIGGMVGGAVVLILIAVVLRLLFSQRCRDVRELEYYRNPIGVDHATILSPGSPMTPISGQQTQTMNGTPVVATPAETQPPHYDALVGASVI